MQCLLSVYRQQKLVSGPAGVSKVNRPFFQQLWASFISNRFHSSDKTLPPYMFDTKTDRWHQLFHVKVFCLVSSTLTGFPAREFANPSSLVLAFEVYFFRETKSLWLRRKKANKNALFRFIANANGNSVSVKTNMLDCRCLYWTSVLSLCFLCDISAQLWGHILITSYTTHLSLRAVSIPSDLKKSLYVCNVKHPCCGQLTEGSLTWTTRHREKETDRGGERDRERERVRVEPIRCWPHLFAPRLLTIYLWSAAAEQPCGNGWDAVELFCRVSHETFQRAPNTSRS